MRREFSFFLFLYALLVKVKSHILTSAAGTVTGSAGALGAIASILAAVATAGSGARSASTAAVGHAGGVVLKFEG